MEYLGSLVNFHLKTVKRIPLNSVILYPLVDVLNRYFEDLIKNLIVVWMVLVLVQYDLSIVYRKNNNENIMIVVHKNMNYTQNKRSLINCDFFPSVGKFLSRQMSIISASDISFNSSYCRYYSFINMITLFFSFFFFLFFLIIQLKTGID